MWSADFTGSKKKSLDQVIKGSKLHCGAFEMPKGREQGKRPSISLAYCLNQPQSIIYQLSSSKLPYRWGLSEAQKLFYKRNECRRRRGGVTDRGTGSRKSGGAGLPRSGPLYFPFDLSWFHGLSCAAKMGRELTCMERVDMSGAGV